MMTPGENLGREPRGHTENQFHGSAVCRNDCWNAIMNNPLIIGVVVLAIM
jgi:hypothetical protein